MRIIRVMPTHLARLHIIFQEIYTRKINALRKSLLK